MDWKQKALLVAITAPTVVLILLMPSFVSPQPQKIVCYSNGMRIGEWVSVGRVQVSMFANRVRFRDGQTGRRIRVIGDCVIADLIPSQ